MERKGRNDRSEEDCKRRGGRDWKRTEEGGMIGMKKELKKRAE